MFARYNITTVINVSRHTNVLHHKCLSQRIRPSSALPVRAVPTRLLQCCYYFRSGMYSFSNLNFNSVMYISFIFAITTSRPTFLFSSYSFEYSWQHWAIGYLVSGNPNWPWKTQGRTIPHNDLLCLREDNYQWNLN